MTSVASFKSLDEWLPWLETLSPREIVLGLDRVREVIERLDLARPGLVINVAGTNGKGSSVAMIEALLLQQGVRTGCYTSPHVTNYNERTRIDGMPASDEAVIAALETVELARGDVPLTFFEFGTLATLAAFEQANVTAWILEVGMGGRLDAVNAIDPDACLVTNVALDHCAWLGDDVESIAREKAAVMRPSKPAIFGSLEVPAAIPAYAAEVGADLLLAGRDFHFEVADDESWCWHGKRHELTGIRRPSLVGPMQMSNASAVLALIEALDRDQWLEPADVGAALAGIELDGRFQQVDERWILDVAHNPAAGQVLGELLRQYKGKRKLVAVAGMLEDKDVAGFIDGFSDQVDQWISVSVDAARGALAAKTAAAISNASQQPCLVVEDLAEALAVADERAGEDGLVLVTGSFYIVGPALKWIADN